MKASAIVLLSLFASSAFAEAWVVTKCSNSDGTVTWESGSDVNKIHLKYANFVPGTLSLDYDQVQVSMKSVQSINEQRVRDCEMDARREVFSGLVTVTASEKNPEILRGQFPENKVEAEVICTKVTTIDQVCFGE
jgi:hypothetical protein